MKRLIVLSAALLVGCGSAESETACMGWLDEPAVSTIGPAPVVLLVRFDPTDHERTISAVRATPCVGAEGPTRFGAWSSEGALSPGDPRDHLGPALPGPVAIPAGAFAWVGVDLDKACVAMGADEPPGVESLTWHPEDGWQAIDGQALVSPVECGEKAPTIPAPVVSATASFDTCPEDDDPCARYVLQDGKCVTVPVCE